MRSLILFIIASCFWLRAGAQQAAGLWKGSFRSSAAAFAAPYRYELLLFQTGTQLSGYSYSAFGNFESVCSVTGTVYPAYMVIRETKTLFQNSNSPTVQQQHLLFFDDEADPRVVSGDWRHIHPTPGVVAMQKGTSILHRHEDANNSALVSILQKTGIIATQSAAPTLVKVLNTDSIRMRSRPIVYADTLRISGQQVRLTIFDEGLSDGDHISLYANGVLLLKNELLRTQAITLVLDWPTGANAMELVFFAESEGSVPPNTGLLQVEVGGTRHHLRFSSSIHTSAAVVLVQQ